MAPKSDITGKYSEHMNIEKMKKEDVSKHPGYIRVRHNPNGRDEYIPLMGVIKNIGTGGRARRNAGAADGSVSFGDQKTAKHGIKANSEKIADLLEQMMLNNLALIKAERKPIPICIWGTHGLGKTSIVKDICESPRRAKKWKLNYVAPAQFTEMGDLHGFPQRVQSSDPGKGIMVYFPPKWAPTTPLNEEEYEAGVLLIDDFNRADPRILNGLMQLFQDGELAGWKLPKNYMIIATANPESDANDYSVNELDPAQKTRMIHIEMVFDINTWTKWANTPDAEGQTRVHRTAINWMQENANTYLTNQVEYKLTTPRSLDNMFTTIRPIENWSIPGTPGFSLMEAIAYGSIDYEPAKNWIDYVKAQYASKKNATISVQDIMNATDANRAEMIELLKSNILDENGNVKLAEQTNIVNDVIAFLDNNADNVNSKYNMNYELVDQLTQGSKSLLPLKEMRVAISDIENTERFEQEAQGTPRKRLTSRGRLEKQGKDYVLYDIDYNMPNLNGFIQENMTEAAYDRLQAERSREDAQAKTNPRFASAQKSIQDSLRNVIIARKNSAADTELQKKILEAIDNNIRIKKNVRAFLMTVSPESVLTFVNAMTSRAGVVTLPGETSPVVDKFDDEAGYIVKQGPNVVLDIGIVAKAVKAEPDASESAASNPFFRRNSARSGRSGHSAREHQVLLNMKKRMGL